MLINKNDIAKYLKFSVNINDNDINPFIIQAEQYLPPLPNGVYYGFSILKNIEYEAYQQNAPYYTGDYVEFNGKIYHALIDGPLNPALVNSSAQWFLDTYQTVYQLGLKPFLVYKAYDLFLGVHGINVTPAGLTQVTDSNYEHINDKRRGEFIASIKSGLMFFEGKLNKLLKDYGFLPAVNSCSDTGSDISNNIGLYVIGARKKTRAIAGFDIQQPGRATQNNTFSSEFDVTLD